MTSGRAQEARALASRLRAELERLGRWSPNEIEPVRLIDAGAFGMNKLGPEEWLQFVLWPRLAEVGAGTAEIPAQSEVATWAVRQFDGDPEADSLLDLLRAIDALAVPTLLDAIAEGNAAAVNRLLDGGADANALDARGLRPLHVVATGANPSLAAFVAAPFRVELPATLDIDDTFDEIARALIAHGAKVDERCGEAGLTPFMLARAFARPDLVEVLLAAGAEPQLRDIFGRSADRFTVLATAARLVQRCATLPMVRAAWLTELHAPVTAQYTSPMVVLEIDGDLPANAFASWPASHPIVAMILGSDAVSRLTQLLPPTYTSPNHRRHAL